MKENPQGPKAWGSAILSVLLIWALEFIVPTGAVDPWGLIHPQKILHLVKALALIQIIGMALMGFLEAKTGIAMSGFLGGLISSTMTTASLAQKSQALRPEEEKVHSVAFLTAILAMLIQAFVILGTGIDNPSPIVFSILLGPFILTLVLIGIRFYKTSTIAIQTEPPRPISLMALAKLSLFIMFVLGLTSGFQQLLGSSAPFIITFVASLFEMHGTVIANIQLYETNHISGTFFVGLLALSFIASCFSKLFLVFTFGSTYIKKKFIIWTVLFLLIQSLNWLILNLFYQTDLNQL